MPTPTRSEKITDLVKKLLRLARCNAAAPAEAAQALNRAMELIDRHRLDIAALDLDEETEKLVCENIHVGWRVTLIKRLVNGILLNYFKVRTCWSPPKLAVVGFEHDVTIAGYVFDFLVRSCNQAVRDYSAAERKARRKVSTRKKQGFISGWMYGVASHLRDPSQDRPEIENSKTALILSRRKDRVDSYLDELFPGASPSKQRKIKQNRTALMEGYLQGLNTTITTPLQGSSTQPKLLS